MTATVARSTMPASAGTGRSRRGIAVRGLVQGVGFRPFVYATATELHLTGSVINDSNGVLIEVEGSPPALEDFIARLVENPPPLALVDHIEITELTPTGGTGFLIGDSAHAAGGRTLAAPDVATCRDCLTDLRDAANRRFRHPFVSCTNCGPRFTIITALPYDRVSTTMAGFPMCLLCRSEYTDPADRRFHAQPIACRDCGPRLELVGPGGVIVRGDDEAMAGTRRLLADGAILAIKGLGGYHLVCDARNEHAVATLRLRKRRGDKPFAIMVADLATARQVAHIGAEEGRLLEDPARPIVLVPRRVAHPPLPSSGPLAGPPSGPPSGLPAGPLAVAPSVAPGNPDLGVLLPYTPLHTLLFGLPGDEPSPEVLVMTSGNLSGEPIIIDDEVALRELAPMVDGWLRHDRPIRIPCDDSVSRVVDGEPLPIRRSRGYAPLPLALPLVIEPTLAVGADLKNTCAIGENRYAWLSQHIGDMDDLRSLETLTRTSEHLRMLTGVHPGRLAADRHPGYRSADWARRNSGGAELASVQHHHAHICSVMAENAVDDGSQVIGIAFDGTGYGTDGAVWGGEVLLADYAGFRRFAHLKYVPLPGGDTAIERPYRMALSHLRSAGAQWHPALPCVAYCPPNELAFLQRQLESGFGCVNTSSMGRLFDAVSAMAGIRQVADYEAQAAVEMEGLARAHWQDSGPPDGYRFELTESGDDEVIADPGPAIRAAARDSLAAVLPGVIGARFHAGVVQLIANLAQRAGQACNLRTVALSGGVFQNALVLAGAVKALRDRGFTVLRHRRVPPNDGGLALGQLMAGAKRIE